MYSNNQLTKFNSNPFYVFGQIFSTRDRWFLNLPVVHSVDIQSQCPGPGGMCFQLGRAYGIPGLHPIRDILGALPIIYICFEVFWYGVT